MSNTPPTTMTFYEAFAANMKATGNLPVPEGWFQTATMATGTITALEKAIKAHGSDKVLLRELVRRLPTALRTASVGSVAIKLTGVMAVFYVGACIESLMVATDQMRTMQNRMATANRMGLRAPWLLPTFTELAARAAASLR
jgi:hypothetical protein